MVNLYLKGSTSEQPLQVFKFSFSYANMFNCMTKILLRGSYTNICINVLKQFLLFFRQGKVIDKIKITSVGIPKYMKRLEKPTEEIQKPKEVFFAYCSFFVFHFFVLFCLMPP